MPRDGSGVHSLPLGYLAVTGEVVQPSNHNPPLEDLSASVTESIARTGVTAITANIPFNDKKITGLGDATADTDALNRRTGDARYYTQTAADAKFVEIGEETPARGYVFGLTLSNNVTDATNDIDIAPGAAASDDTTPIKITLASALTKRLDSGWVVGNGNGGLDTGSIANTTYHIWLIRRPDTGVVDALFSTSATAPTMPADYTQKRRVGSIIRLSGSIVTFSQRGDEFLLSVPTYDINTSTLSTTASLYALTVPIGIKVDALVDGATTHPSVTQYLLVTSPDQTDTLPASGGPWTTYYNGSPGRFSGAYRTNTSGQIRMRSSQSTTSVFMHTRGWVDTRGR